MEKLDQSYINELSERAKQGYSNAFAELFMSLCDRVYLYFLMMTSDEEKAVKGVRNVFLSALTELSFLNDTGLVIPWILRIAFNYHCEREETYYDDMILSRVLSLPLAESQVLIMTRVQGMDNKDAADMLNVSKRTVTRFCRIADRHLGTAYDQSGKKDAGNGRDTGSFHISDRKKRIGHERAARILRSIFDELEIDPNTVPIEALASYTVYRRERFSIQRTVLIVAMAVFILMPSLFLLPRYEITGETEGERGLPVYTIEVNSILPAYRVTARLLKHSMPVYEAGAKTFLVEPTRNGTMELTVELLNRQYISKEVEVTDVDSKGPELIGKAVEGDYFVIHVSDSGIGVDYKEVYALSESGAVIKPEEAGEERGIVFAYPNENWDIYIPDHIGNTLHLSLKLK